MGLKVVLPLLVLAVVAGCGGDGGSKSSATKGATPEARDADESVAAVAQTDKPAIHLRFVTLARPKAGAATPLRLELSGEPGQATLRLQGSGIVVEPAVASVVVPDGGKTVSQSVTVTPQAAGLAEIAVRILPPGDGAQEIAYAVPLLVEAAGSP